MGSLINSPGVVGQIDNVPFCRSPAHAIRLLKVHRAVTDAGDHGAVSVYRADGGRWNCLFSRWRSGAWLDKWHPAINGDVAGSE